MAKTRDFDAAEFLDTPKALAAFVSDALETGEPAIVADALGVAALNAKMNGPITRGHLTPLLRRGVFLG